MNFVVSLPIGHDCHAVFVCDPYAYAIRRLSYLELYTMLIVLSEISAAHPESSQSSFMTKCPASSILSLCSVLLSGRCHSAPRVSSSCGVHGSSILLLCNVATEVGILSGLEKELLET